jgi:putative Mg2+ transporter-C (MgtC) family protein
MEISLLDQLEMIGRIAVAALCGLAIGYERKNKLKDAGVRTHMIVAIGAALFMVVSQYGFEHVMGHTGYKLDPSRIASQVVSGIGFLGAGMIFVRKDIISGLTTAAGMWTTAAVGLAIGGQLYLIGILSTLIILIVQVMLPYILSYTALPEGTEMALVLDKETGSLSEVETLFHDKGIYILAAKLDNTETTLNLQLHLKLPKAVTREELLSLVESNLNVQSVSFE